MFKAERFKEIFDKYSNRPILLYGDPDCDGLISLLLMCQFCEMMGKQYSYFVNSDRFHGFTLPIDSIRGYLIISADFTITREELVNLVDNDVAVLSTDHHDVEREFIEYCGNSAEGIVYNNQYPFEPDEDQYLSGAGVFYELICSLYPEFKSKEREALVGITLLSDIRQIENNKAREYLKATYTSDTSKGYMKYLIESTVLSDFSFGMPRVDRNFIDFTLSPTINSLLRADKTTEAVNFILGKGLATTSTHDLQKTLVEEMSAKATVLKLPNVHILAVNSLDFLNYNVKLTSYIGLFCSDYKDKHSGISTLGLIFENGKILRTSFRGKYDDIHYLAGFQNIGVDAKGHGNAFGIPTFNPTEDTWIQINDLIADLESNHQQTLQVYDSNNLMITLTQIGSKLATENCYVRDMYRSYIRYTGNNAKIVKTTYKKEEFSSQDYMDGIKPDITVRGVDYKYIRDSEGNPIPKYIEYLVDGRKVKSFGVLIEDGLILPMLEKGYIQLYIKSPLL